MARKLSKIDRDKLRAVIRRLGDDCVRYMLDDAIELLSPTKLRKLAKKHVDLSQLSPDADTGTKATLLQEVRAFAKASLAGEYYESFDVNSRNCRQRSAGTSSWIAAFVRFMGRCVAAAKHDTPAEVREGMDILLGLLDHIDECRDDVVFFADEGGSWQVSVDWPKVLPAWFKVLSVTAGPEAYARRVTEVVSRHYRYGREEMLRAARRVATSEQRKALAEAEGRPAHSTGNGGTGTEPAAGLR